MNDLTISRARSVWGPGLATHSCSLPSKTVSSHTPPAALYVAANFSCKAGSTLSSSAPCMISIGTSVAGSRRSWVRLRLAFWIRCFLREPQIDGHDQNATRGNGTVHGLLGEAILAAPGAAVQIEHRRKRPWALWLIDAGHQLAPGRRAQELHLADLELEFGRRI